MNLPRFSIKQPILVNLITIFVFIVGLVSLLNLPREAIPPVSFNMVTIQTIYPGATAEDVEKIISAPIEEAIQNIKGIKKISSTSFESISSIVVELKPSAKLDSVYNDIQDAVKKVQDLPEDIDDPDVQKLDIEIPVLSVSLSGDLSELELRKLADNLETKLEKIKGVSSISKSGYRDREIWVEVDSKKMLAYNLALSQIINSIKFANQNIPGGTIYDKKKELIIRTTGEFKKVNDIETVILRANDEGNITRVKDIANVEDTFEEATVLHRSLGYSDISLIVKKVENGDSIKIGKLVKKTVKEFQKTAPKKLHISYINDTTHYIKRRLAVLTNNSILGFILVLITLLLFLNPRVALMTALGIPFSIFTTFIIMSYFGISLNMIAMFGLILVLGMLVDDAIVIAENSYRYMEEGMLPKDAAEKGTNEVLWPVLASVLTTVAAFFPLLTMSGIMGKFIKHIPMMVIIALSASLVEAFLVLPSHLADFVRPLNHDYPVMPQNLKLFQKFIWKIKHYFSGDRKGSESGWYKALVRQYKKLLTFVLKNRYKFLIFVIIFFIGSLIFAFKVMRFELMPSKGIDQFNISIETPDDSSLEETAVKVTEIENLVKALPKNELDTYSTIIGDNNDSSLSFGGSDNLALVSVNLTEEEERKRTAQQIIMYLRKQTKSLKGFKSIKFTKGRRGPPVGSPVEIHLRGDNFTELIENASKVESLLKTIPGVEGVKNSYEKGKEQITITFDKKKAAIAGINVAQAGSIVRTAFSGTKAGSIRFDNQSVNILVKFANDFKYNLKNLKKISIPNTRGQLVPLESIAHFTISKSIKKIDRIDLKRDITVSADVNPKITTSRKANRLARKKIAKMHLPQDISLKFGGEMESSQESLLDLGKAFLVALLLIYIILATVFQSFLQPFIIMLSIPFGILGIIWALFFHGMSLGFFPLMAIVALSGVVVNDAIVLIDFINRYRKTHTNLEDAVIKSGIQRLRPVLLTTITTAAGLLSMAYSIGGGDPMLQPLAVAFMWGLIFATFLTLILIPTVYVIAIDFKKKLISHKKTIKS